MSNPKKSTAKRKTSFSNSTAIKNVTIDGFSLTFDEFIAVARFGAKVKIAGSAKKAMANSRKLTEKISFEHRVAYGISTGFGDFATIAVPEELSNKLSTNLILSHCTGTGEPYSIEQVRGMMLLRANALCVGISGVRPLIVEMLVEMLNKGVTPYIPQKGSLGASGDLAPLSHMGLVLLGKGEAYFEGKKLSGQRAMDKASIKTIDTLVSKEGLGITNGTCAMTSVGALNLYDTIEAARIADVISAMSFIALTGQLTPFQERMHTARGHKGQIKVARNLRLLTKGSKLVKESQGLRVQDAYSLRCIPQVHGAIRDSLDYIKEKVEIELNAVTDNPLIFPEDEAVISGGNFHGEPMALPFDFLGIACSELASISERRLERMVNQQLSNGLPPFLTVDGGINSGFMIVQYTAASMVSENKVLAHPACVDNIPSSANQEDFVSMGTTAARKSGQILENTRSVLAYELLTACQALDLRLAQCNQKHDALPLLVRNVLDRVRKDIKFMDTDREIRIDIEIIEKFIRSGELSKMIEKIQPDFN